MYYLGTVTGSSGICYNNRTGPSGVGTFTIPRNVESLYLVPDASGVYFSMSTATGVTAFAGLGIHQGKGAQLQPNVINGPFKTIENAPATVVAVGHDQAIFVSVRVFAGGE